MSNGSLFDLPPEEPKRKPYEDIMEPERAGTRPRREFLGGPQERGRETAHARRSDPAESHEAAASVTDLTDKQDAVLALLKSAGGPLADPEIAELYRDQGHSEHWPIQSESGLRTRRSELVRKGLVEKAGSITLYTGRRASTWQVTK